MKNKLLIRINQHLNDIKHEKDTPVSRHYNKHKADMILHIVQLVSTNDADDRNKWENYWISRLHTITPKGLNILD